MTVDTVLLDKVRAAQFQMLNCHTHTQLHIHIFSEHITAHIFSRKLPDVFRKNTFLLVFCAYFLRLFSKEIWAYQSSPCWRWFHPEWNNLPIFNTLNHQTSSYIIVTCTLSSAGPVWSCGRTFAYFAWGSKFDPRCRVIIMYLSLNQIGQHWWAQCVRLA